MSWLGLDIVPSLDAVAPGGQDVVCVCLRGGVCDNDGVGIDVIGIGVVWTQAFGIQLEDQTSSAGDGESGSCSNAAPLFMLFRYVP